MPKEEYNNSGIRNNITTVQIDIEYRDMQLDLLRMRKEVRATWNRFPGRSGLLTVLLDLERVAIALQTARRSIKELNNAPSL